MRFSLLIAVVVGLMGSAVALAQVRVAPPALTKINPSQLQPFDPYEQKTAAKSQAYAFGSPVADPETTGLPFPQATDNEAGFGPSQPVDPTGLGLPPWVVGWLPMPDPNFNYEPVPVVSQSDSFLLPPEMRIAGCYDPFSLQFAYGSRAVQPYRLGWVSYDDFTFQPSTAVKNGGGKYQSLEWNFWLRYAQPVREDWILAITAVMNSKWWTGPDAVPFPPDGGQFMADFQLNSARPGPLNFQFGITPQLNSDFVRRLTHEAFMLDGKAVAIYKATPEWTFVGGVALWNRVTNHIVPHAGVIWTPNDLWEFRLLYPKARISYYQGNYRGYDVWTYASAEYYLDGYQVDLDYNPRIKTRAELQDHRVLLGINASRGPWSFFLEGGAIVDRKFRFRSATPDVSIGDGFILRTGFIY